MVLGGRPLIAIGYKYNARKVISFIVTDNAGITQAGLPYLSKYSNQFTNIYIRPVDHPLVISNFFGQVNEIDSHSKSGQSGLALDKFWVTQCGCMRLCTTVDMVITITNCWKLFRYEVKID